jgi:hypothetical protein
MAQHVAVTRLNQWGRAVNGPACFCPVLWSFAFTVQLKNTMKNRANLQYNTKARDVQIE